MTTQALAYNPQRLFLASCIALVATAMTFAIRAGILPQLGQDFDLSAEEIGWCIGTAFWGFTLAQIFGGPLVDVLGMGRLLTLAFIGHAAGIGLTIASNDFWTLFGSTLLVGIANGLVEAACNPLVATLYPDQKTKMLNRFHVWFPGGIVIGGLASYLMAEADLGWQAQVALILVPTAAYGFLFWGQSFPKTERVTSGVSTSDMLKACASPLFIFMGLLMLLTAATELGTNQYISVLLGSTGVSPILVLVFINGIMAVGRGFAGELVHKLAPQGMLLGSAILATVGLVLLSLVSGPLTFVAAFIFACGICYFWPTMLGFVAENTPKTGAMGLSIMGGLGMLSVSLVLPFMGKIYDGNLQTLGNELQAGAQTLQTLALMPAVLSLAFGALVIGMRKKKSTH